MRKTFSITAGFRRRPHSPDEGDVNKTVAVSPPRQSEMRVIADLSGPDYPVPEASLTPKEKKLITGCAFWGLTACAFVTAATAILDKLGY